MKAVFATLLLLFQLQPVFGSVLCLGGTDRVAQQECRMPDHGQAPTTTLAAPGAANQSCELATICAPAPLAVPGLSSSLDTAIPMLGSAGALAATLPLGISPAPPFHPPRV